MIHGFRRSQERARSIGLEFRRPLVWNFADRISERHFPPGVHKHRCIEEAQELRDRWEEVNFQRYWASKDVTKKTLG